MEDERGIFEILVGWLSSDSWQSTIVVLAFVALVAAIIAFFLIAIFQNREIQLWPPKLGPRQELGKSTSLLTTVAKGIRITHPAGKDSVQTAFEVRGSINGLPPQVELWVFTTDHNGPTTRYWPQNRAIIRDDGTWYGKVSGIGGEPGAKRTFGAFLVGTDGQILVKYYKETMAELVQPRKETLKYQPLKMLPSDIVMCHEIDVVLADKR